MKGAASSIQQVCVCARKGQLAMKHGHSWEGAASEFNVAWRGVWRPTWLLAHRCRVWAFFFYITDSCRLGLICADLAWFVPNQADSARIGPYRLNQVVSVSDWNGRNRPWIMPEQSKSLWMRPKHPISVIPQFYIEYLLLLLCFYFCFVFLAFFFLCFVN